MLTSIHKFLGNFQKHVTNAVKKYRKVLRSRITLAKKKKRKHTFFTLEWTAIEQGKFSKGHQKKEMFNRKTRVLCIERNTEL